MLNLDVTSNFKAVSASIDALVQKQMPFATAMALTSVVKQAQAAETAALPSVFDAPTLFTKRAVGVQVATKSSLSAAVYVRPDQAKYLTLEETGGTRLPAGRALLMPVGAKLNSYGNLPKNALQSLKGRKDVFVGTVHGVGGVWQRLAPGKGAGRRGQRQAGGLKLLIAFEPQAKYQARFGFVARAEAVCRANIGPAYVAALQKALRSAR